MNTPMPTKNIIDTVAAQGSFKTLSKALYAAGLADVLKGEGPFTMFAPTDAAFEKLPAGTLEKLLKPENKAELASLLKYHVSPGRVMAADVGKLHEAKTVQGESAQIKTEGGKVTIDGANVTLSDITSSNGVIHAIDKVIGPTVH